MLNFSNTCIMHTGNKDSLQPHERCDLMIVGRMVAFCQHFVSMPIFTDWLFGITDHKNGLPKIGRSVKSVGNRFSIGRQVA